MKFLSSFQLKDQEGKLFSSEELGGRYGVIYFYPKAMTSGCTKEAQDFSRLIERFLEKNMFVIGVSPDKPETLKKFNII